MVVNKYKLVFSFNQRELDQETSDWIEFHNLDNFIFRVEQKYPILKEMTSYICLKLIQNIYIDFQNINEYNRILKLYGDNSYRNK